MKEEEDKENLKWNRRMKEKMKKKRKMYNQVENLKSSKESHCGKFFPAKTFFFLSTFINFSFSLYFLSFFLFS